MHYVYWIHTEDQKDIRKEGYVGHAANFKRRMHDHERQSRFKHTLFYGKVRQHGWDSLLKEIIATVATQKEAAILEYEYRPTPFIGWNQMEGGSVSPMHLQSVRDKVSVAMRGKKQPSEQIQKRVARNTGKKRTQEQCARISKGLSEAAGTKKRYLVTFPDGHKEIVFGLKPFCKKHNISSSWMFKMANGRDRCWLHEGEGWNCERVTTSHEQLERSVA